ncbi:hypothetical protein [Candidatus Enterococcus ferrettii]|uniref:Integral membrane protein n=1 Tax=Candidatus Enterococcus ferrettii TaxID=2815324 RepID=A0ABV0ETK6_9ENTE|nr:hypothetical protein [Enterococcus sp. 665A]MBO1340229.1 hypothetical protein [Enterococcus sp. 665A]
MNRKIGMVSSAVTLSCVILFALFMLLNWSFGAYAICIVLALGYVSMVSAFNSFTKKEYEAAKLASLSFAIIYAVFVLMVYYAQITTLMKANPTNEIAFLIDYKKFGLFFSYNLFGYAILSISTFFLGLTISVKNKTDQLLRKLLLIHGLFSSVALVPIFGIFDADSAGSDIMGIAALEIWCIYFIPICVLSYKHFKNIEMK